LENLGYSKGTIDRKDTPPNRKQMTNIYVLGGFPEILKALGELRPTRLLSKLDRLDVASRCLQSPHKVQVVAVEPVGKMPIQGIQTSTGTYIGEGYLHHNTYANRLADNYHAKDASKRMGYRHTLGHPLHPDNSGGMQWGPKYRTLHTAALREMHRVAPFFILDMKDHIRAGQVMPVTDWWICQTKETGYRMLVHKRVSTPSLRYGQNHAARIPYESVILFERSN